MGLVLLSAKNVLLLYLIAFAEKQYSRYYTLASKVLLIREKMFKILFEI